MGEPVSSLGKISVLSAEVAERIAAGEVIDRPASVVKELVENSIDAGSTLIRVEVRGGGRLLVRVVDDGEGMCRDDALLAFRRHATSKIRTDQDLFSVRTLGFRGEALPSIAAVSKVRMLTVSREEPTGTEVVVQGGDSPRVRAAGAPPGTLLEVQELFYNTPARRKFLKSASTEMGHISHLLQQQALAYPGISFRLIHEDRCLMDLPSVPERVQRVRQIYGRDFTEQLVVVEEMSEGMALWAMLSKPPSTKSTRAYQEVFVNGRAVSCPSVLHAVYDAYGTALMKGQHPAALLFLDVDRQRVDVNVHPAKRELRFQDQRLVHDWVRSCVKRRLEEASRADLGYNPENTARFAGSNRVQEATQTYVASQWPETTLSSAAPFRQGGEQKVPAPEAQMSMADSLGDSVSPLRQIYGTYILASIRGDFWIVDQHAAHERVLYEQYLKAIGQEQVPVQPLLIPEPLELDEGKAAVLAEWLEHLKILGLELESFGGRAFVVRAVPAFLTKADLRDLLADLIEDWVLLEKEPSTEERQKRVVATLACHGAVKAGEILTPPEMAALLKDMLSIPEAMTCPHGRPMRIRYSRGDLENLFRR